MDKYLLKIFIYYKKIEKVKYLKNSIKLDINQNHLPTVGQVTMSTHACGKKGAREQAKSRSLEVAALDAEKKRAAQAKAKQLLKAEKDTAKGRAPAVVHTRSFFNSREVHDHEEGSSLFGLAALVLTTIWIQAIDWYAKKLEENEYDVETRDHTYIRIPNVLSHYDIVTNPDGTTFRRHFANSIRIRLTDDSIREYKLDVAHYGPRVDEVYTNRGLGVYSKLGITPAFRAAQEYAIREHGMYLVDLSNIRPDGSINYDFRMYRNFEDLPEIKNLWHGFDRVFVPRDLRRRAKAEAEVTPVAPSAPIAGGGGSGGAAEDEDDADADIMRLARVQGTKRA